MLRKFTSASALSLFMAVSAGLWAAPARSAPVSFGFTVPLLVDYCPPSYVCGGVGRIWVTLELDDLRIGWGVGQDHLVAGAVLFPTFSHVDPSNVFSGGRLAAPLQDDETCGVVEAATCFSGVYSYDAVTGLATLVLDQFSAEGGGDGGPYGYVQHQVASTGGAGIWWHHCNPNVYPPETWYPCGTVSWSSTPSRLSAEALVGRAVVPIPAAVYLFMSALAGLVGVKRFARKS
jgi:hypothetical protein